MLPRYTVRESRKAKHVSLKISVSGNLEVIVPHGFDQKHIPAIVKRKQRWIERVTRRMEDRQALVGLETTSALPVQVALRAIAETWQVEYHPTPIPGIRIVEQPHCKLVLSGNTGDQEICKVALQRWVSRKAQFHLFPWLHAVSQELDLPFGRALIRKQKTRWGSCSSAKTISLNCKLLFLPSPLVRYVFIHELCHTVHLNHSPRFWALVGSYESDYQQLDSSLRDARAYVPLWMEE
ncbi:M48 family metallopeptidase [Leptothermofonsia sichuanensis E412]|uniref:M48 family metallopeptidase n=1 Tax=Leptothermofonsia sichuanensis TaxID=2917832 RepID=UPI001CA719AE|nr:SprT family zinc-dependent metalloprotease [Leptothermofonsia sichuanensis]QZZ20848.1 M48 family metallopeptidase [Leptothermofonsia sichuanensis E412]